MCKELDIVDLINFVGSKTNEVSHLKLQKLLYYIDSYHIAIFKKKIISDSFEAWVHGPISPQAYEYLKERGVYGVIKKDFFPPISLKGKVFKKQIDLVNEVLENYGDLSGDELEQLTHLETPWINARKGLDIGEKGTTKLDFLDIQRFFSKKLGIS